MMNISKDKLNKYDSLKELELEYINTKKEIEKLQKKLKKLKTDIIELSSHNYTFKRLQILKSKRKVIDQNKLKDMGIDIPIIEQEITLIKMR